MKTSQLAMPVWSLSAVGVVGLLLLYFGADIVAKGLALNTLTPWGPYLGAGTLIWVLIAALVWTLFVQPTLEFLRLLRGGVPLRKKVKNALRALKVHRGKGTAMSDLYAALYNALARNDYKEMKKAILEYEETGEAARETRKIICSCCNLAGIGTVISSNRMLDGAILIGVQMRMITRLAAVYGYRTSPVFILLCLVWAYASAILFALFADSAEEVAASVADEAIMAIGGNALTEKLGVLVTKRATEYVLSWVSVYVTGCIFRVTHAQGRSGVSVKKVIGYRREGYMEAGKEVLVQLRDITLNKIFPFAQSETDEARAEEATE